MSEAKCPWCGEMNGDLWELWPHSYGADSWSEDIECGWCEKPIRVVCRVSADYEIEKRGES